MYFHCLHMLHYVNQLFIALNIQWFKALVTSLANTTMHFYCFYVNYYFIQQHYVASLIFLVNAQFILVVKICYA